jgi:hypothetical protein
MCWSICPYESVTPNACSWRSLSYPTDTSVQLDYTSVSILPTFSSVTAPTILFNDGTSGIYNPSNNVIKMFTNNIDALTIDSNQCLYGNGTGLTNI